MQAASLFYAAPPRMLRRWLSAALLVATAAPASAELVVTEMMINPTSPGDDAWEWIEVLNTGSENVDLAGAIFGKLNEAENAAEDIGAMAAHTIVPAGGVAVLYDGAASGFDDALFRAAWGLPGSVPLVAAAGFPDLSNSGVNRNFGLWTSATAYETALADDGLGTVRVASFAGAAFSMNYASGFPSVAVDGPSLAWNGAGSYQDGANWSASIAGGANVTSVPVIQDGQPINDVLDLANPGRVPPGSAAGGLLITEIMYDPASPEPAWEWIEVFNNTGAAIDFAATPHVLHDTTTPNSGDLETANITNGVLAQGATAVLFNDAISQQDMIDAWDPGGALGTLFIPVAEFPSLGNGGDTIAIWGGIDDYLAAAAGATPPRTTAGAIAVVAFDDATPVWPSNNDRASIYLQNLVLPPATGSSWLRSAASDSVGSTAAAEVLADVPLHPGGDIGSPGTLATAPPTGDADFDDDGDVDGADFLRWQRGLGSGSTNSTGDANGSGTVDADDLAIWRGQFRPPAAAAATAVPEPGGWLLMALATWGATAGLSSRAKRR